ncbi:MAG: polysaccharide biosynthesis tyrosine autokinase, partial [Bacteroidia bacterium]|nr:polysaccharide biosynthesis tyrosine autokinase [Bacteroidia bacterium]
MEENKPKGIPLEEYDIKRFIGVLIRGRWYLLLTPLAFFIPAALYLRYTPYLYESGGTISVQVRTEEIVPGSKEFRFSGETGREVIEVLKSRDLMEKVVQRLDLQVAYYERGKVLTTPLYRSEPIVIEFDTASFNWYDIPLEIEFNDEKRFVLRAKDTVLQCTLDVPIVLGPKARFVIHKKPGYAGELAEREFEIVVRAIPGLVASLASSVKVIFQGEGVFAVSFVDKLPHRAADVVNTLLQVYLQNELALSRRSVDQTIQFVDTLLMDIAELMRKSESNLESYEKNRKMVVFPMMHDLNKSRITRFQEELLNMDLQEMILNSVIEYVEKAQSADPNTLPAFAPSLQGFEFPELAESIGAYREALLERATLLQKVSPKSPVVAANNLKLATIASQIKESISTTKAAFARRRNYIRDEIKKLDQRIVNYPSIEREFSNVVKEFENYRQIYSDLLAKKTDLAISKAAIVSKSRVINYAFPNTNPVSPKRNQILYGSLIIGFLVGFVYVIVREVLRDKISFRGELDLKTAVPIIGEIVKTRRKLNYLALQVFSSSKSLVTESFRLLRTNVEFVAGARYPMIVTITSTVSGEGKSYISVNFAGIMSLLNKRVILVDLDLRKPRLHLAFNLVNDAGVSTYLIGKDSLRDVIQSTGYHNFDVITSGPVPPNPAELVSGDAFLKMIDELKQQYDCIVIDTSPVGLVTDSIPAIKISNVGLYVFRADYSRKVFLQNVERLREEHALNQLYLVFNY